MQNGIETAGIATVSISMAPHITLATGVSRALHIRFPFGDPFGEPGDSEMQRMVLESALRWIYEAPEPNRLFLLRVQWRRSRRRRQRQNLPS
jgi:hypothetical protein